MKITYLLLFVLGGTIFGAIVGYYGKCTTGACPLTANPFRGAIWGAFIGIMLGLSILQGSGSVNAAETKNISVLKGEEDFSAKIANSKGVAVLDFYAEWCPPCKKLAPILAKIADFYGAKVNFYKMNVDNNQSLAGKFSVDGIPCVIFFKDGNEVSRLVGLLQESKYKEEIDKILK